ncbi:MAG: FAD:protein FMN transferase [Candidatus Parcubacteria bacterium]|nr:FAD:protein FMN transferase [Candidatus Parcubacteria bacterium]
MKRERTIMGMPVVIDIIGNDIPENIFEKVFSYFHSIDERFSVYKETSEITKINHGIIKEADFSDDMRKVFELCEETKKLSGGYFDIRSPGGFLDPSGLVKGWSLYHAAEILKTEGLENFYISVGSDMEVLGKNENGLSWKIGIRNPFNEKEIVKVLNISDRGVATSGNQTRGKHIYNPSKQNTPADEITSITVIGPNIYEADRFATPAFAMGKRGIDFIESLACFEGYAIDKNGIATMTSGFEKYL